MRYALRNCHSSNHRPSSLVLIVLIVPIVLLGGGHMLPVQSQVRAPSAVYMKIAPNTSQQLAVTPKEEHVSITGVRALNRLSSQHRIQSMERVFRPAGRFEARHRQWGLHRWYRVTYSDTIAPTAMARTLRQTSAVDAAMPVYPKRLHGRPTPPSAGQQANRATPSDPEYATQWHYNNTGQTDGTPDADINLSEAHAVAHAAPDVVVSVVDSGIDLDHPDIQGRLWINSEEDVNGNGLFDRVPVEEGGDLDSLDNDNNGFVDDVVGYDHADDDPIPSTVNPANRGNSHGMHVAGIVAARNGNHRFGAGVAGGDGTAASGARLMVNQVFARSTGGFAEAIVYAADMGAVVSQNSWGYTEPGVYETPILDAMDYFRANAGGPDAPMEGGVVVVAAGNANSGAEYYPAAYAPTLSVASTDDADRKSSFSNYGDHIDMAAPGGQFGTDGIWSTVHTEQGGFASFSGTSMAAPHVSGAIAVLLSPFPGISNDDMEHLIAASGDDIRAENSRPLGRRLNLLHALDGLDATPPAAISDVSASPAATTFAGAHTTLFWTAPGDDGTTGTATTYDVRYRIDGPLETLAAFEAASPVSHSLVPAPSGTTESLAVDGLPFGTDVHLAVRAIDAFGNAAALSNSVSVRTPPAPVGALDRDTLTATVMTDTAGTSNKTYTETIETTLTNTGPAGSALLYRVDDAPASLGDDLLVQTVTPQTDTLHGGENQSIVFTIDPSGWDPGTYETHRSLSTSDPDARSILLVFELTVVADPLPVEWARFQAVRDGPNVAVLSWTTASETHNAGFAVQHRPPKAEGFARVGFVNGAGTTSEPQRYRFRVRDLPPGQHAFRLQQQDTDGTTAFSDVVTVDVEAPRLLSLRLMGANPVRGQTTVAFTVPEGGPATVGLYNVLGQRVRRLFDGTATAGDEHTVAVSTQDLPSGMYFVRLATSQGTRTRQIAVVQ